MLILNRFTVCGKSSTEVKSTVFSDLKVENI